MKTWPLTKVPEVANIDSFITMGVEIGLIFAIQAVVAETRADFQNYHILPGNLVIGKVPEVTLYFFTAGVRNGANICSTGNGYQYRSFSPLLG